MDFFGHQDRARRRTAQLVAMFVLAVAGVVASVYVAVRLILLNSSSDSTLPLWDAQLFGQVAFLTLSVILVASVYKTLSLHAGGKAIATLLGGRELLPNSAQGDERRLLNVVEEMAIAAGMPVPTVFLLDQETSINAFAAGFSQDDAVIGVTRGALDALDRDQLQGVIGHEFSHILNRDTRLNLRLVGLLHGILVIAMIGRIVLESAGRGGGRKKGGGLAIFGLALLVIGGIGVFFGRWIKAAISRQREFLADAAAVQFTRNPGGLAGALSKIAEVGGAKMKSAHAEETSHFFFANGLGKNLFAILATHPPLEERIARLDPALFAEYLEQGANPTAAPPNTDDLAALAGLVGRPPAPAAAARRAPEPSRAKKGSLTGRSAPGNAAAALTARVGQLEPQHVEQARALVGSLPEGLLEAAREPLSAQAIVLCLLLDRDPAVRAQQSAIFTETPAPLRFEVNRFAGLVQATPRSAHLALLDLALPALATMSATQAQQFLVWVDRLALADQRLALFELVLQRALRRHLGKKLNPAAGRQDPGKSLPAFAKEISVVLSALAWSGHPNDPKTAEHALTVGYQEFLLEQVRLPAALLPAEHCRLEAVDRALSQLDLLALRHKKPLLAACAATVAADRHVQIEEAELLRVIADTLGCPVPPLPMPSVA